MHLRRVPVDGLTLEVAEAGGGGRPLLAVHGFTGSKDDFTHLVEPLAGRGWHVVAPDLRGHGASDHPPGRESYDFPLLAADVLALAGALSWDRFTVVGHSMGGMLAQLLALEHPHRVAGMVLVSTFHGPVRGVDPDLVQLGSMIVEQAGMAGLHQALTARRQQNPRAAAMFERMVRERPGWEERSERRLLATSPDLWRALAPRFLTQEDRLAPLARIGVPTEVIVGEDDQAMRADCERIAAAVPGARLAVVPGAAHAPQFENEPAFWRSLVDALDRLAAGTPVPGGGARR